MCEIVHVEVSCTLFVHYSFKKVIQYKNSISYERKISIINNEYVFLTVNNMSVEQMFVYISKTR